MSGDEADAMASLAGANSYYVRRTGEWQEFNTDSFTIEGREAQLMVVNDNKLVLLERRKALRILRSGEGLLYVPLQTTRRDPEFHFKHSRKPKRKKNKMEPLLHELNSHMALMNKIMIRQWVSRSQAKEIDEHQKIPQLMRSKTDEPAGISTDIHKQPNAVELSYHSTSSSDTPTVPPFPKSFAAGKKREFVVTPDSLRAISKFSKSNIDKFTYRGRVVVSPDMFDKDDDYCRMVLHKLNPVVDVERSSIVEEVIKKSQRTLKETTGQKLPLTKFAATLGLVGAEKKKFMSDILEQRRRMRKAVQKVQNSDEDAFMTDSSAVDSELHPSECRDPRPSRNKTEPAKRRKTAPERVSKRLKSESAETSVTLSRMPLSSDKKIDAEVKKTKRNAMIGVSARESKIAQTASKRVRKRLKSNDSEYRSLLPPSSSDSSDYKRKKSRMKKSTKAVSDHDKENRKKLTTRSQPNIVSNEDDSDEDKSPARETTKAVVSSKPLRRAKVLRAANAGKISQKQSLSFNESVSDKSQLKRRDLERVIEEDTSSTIAKQTQLKRIGDVSPPKSPLSLRKKGGINNTEASRKLNSSSNKSFKMRCYSFSEDQAILDYILKENNQRLVKGTVMWKNLQKVFYTLSNESRTWQSLKNRYLKYILPNLKYYCLSYDKEKLLRSGEYLGEITRKKKESKENSIFKTQPVVSASNVLRLRNKPKDADRQQMDEPKPSTSKGGGLADVSPSGSRGGPASSTPKTERRGRDPTYSELTRRFRSRVPADTDSSEDFEITAAQPGTRKLYNVNA